jgi:argininosuccinate lyase
MDQYNESLSMDRVFYAQDIKGSIAYARANVKTGILTQEEFEVIERGLREVLQEWEEGKFAPAPGDEGKQAQISLSEDQLLRRKEIFILRTSAA